MGNIFEKFSIGSKPYIVIALLIFCFALPPAIKVQPLDRDEARFMQATMQMFENKDFVQIRFQDEARNKKPIGIHWLQAAALKISGDPLARNPLPMRMVSLLGAILCAICAFEIGKTLIDRRAGLAAGVLMASSLLLSTEAHIAKTDAAMAGFIALAFVALAKLKFENGAIKSALLFWFALGAAVLIKGPVPLMVIGFALLAMAILEKGLAWAKPLWDLRGILLFLAMVLPWFIAIGVVTDWQFYKDAIGQDLAPKLNGTSENKPVPPGMHTLIAPILLWPGSIFLGAAIWAGIKFRKDSKARFLLAWIIPAWLVFELSPAKLAHYTLPTHAAIAVLAMMGLFAGAWQSRLAKWSGIVFFVFGLLVVGALPLYLNQEYSPEMKNFAFVAAAIILGFGLIGLAFAIKNSNNFVPFALISACAFALMVKGQMLPNIDALDVSQRISNELIAQNLHPRLSKTMKGQNLIGAGYQEPSLIFLTRSDARLDSIENAMKVVKIGDAAVIERSQMAAFLDALPDNMTFAERRKIDGLNYSKGDEVEILIGEIISVN